MTQPTCDKVFPLIVFDMDGTLFKTDTSFIPTVTAFMVKYDRPIPTTDFILHFCGEPIHVFVEWLDSLKIERPLTVLLAEFDDLEIETTDRLGELYPGVIVLLDRLVADGYELAICSNGTQRYIGRVLDRFGLRHYFTRVALPRFKGETKSILLAELIGTEPRPLVVMIGDRIHDITAARDNHATSIGAAYGYGGTELAQADYTVQQPSHILPIITSLKDEKCPN